MKEALNLKQYRKVGVEMIISRKRFQEEIDKAVMQRQDEIYREQNLRDDFRCVRDDIDSLRRRINELERTVYKPIEEKKGSVVVCNY